MKYRTNFTLARCGLRIGEYVVMLRARRLMLWRCRRRRADAAEVECDLLWSLGGWRWL